ncbi:hypothetical protein AEQU1_01180 [Aequorivita sp. CIP111184]|nr:hypothetical protein AEQU1_01180 [Aequorivita sp. CIP111184]
MIINEIVISTIKTVIGINKTVIIILIFDDNHPSVGFEKNG